MPVPTMNLFTLPAVGSLEVFGGFARWEISAQFFLHCVDMGSEESWLVPEKRAPLGSRAWLRCNKNKHNDRLGPQRPENRDVTQRAVTQRRGRGGRGEGGGHGVTARCCRFAILDLIK
ncbi:Uncharacterized protein DAT39_020822 [Clarias magur]|uniref:Uncharacterized protein n=1 Tax=Clarias magur TaxID=1594786 RepID=A0A8J4WRM6_CLAMG|nr:Uncharacterized protein DAT39_020822 [Clarias magur]